MQFHAWLFLCLQNVNMKIAIPQNDIVLCKLKSGPEKTTKSGFIYVSNEVPTYEVVSVGPTVSKSVSLIDGDIIRTNSKGSIVHIEDDDYYMFKAENVVGKVEGSV